MSDRSLTEADFEAQVSQIASGHQAMFPSVVAHKVWVLVKSRDAKTAQLVAEIFEEIEKHSPDLKRYNWWLDFKKKRLGKTPEEANR